MKTFKHLIDRLLTLKTLRRAIAFVLVLTLGLIGSVYYSPWFFSPSTAQATVIELTNTAQTTWVVPSDWNSSDNTIATVGAGGGGRTGGNSGSGGAGGGGYSASSNLALTPGATVTINVGAGGTGGIGSPGALGGDTYICNTNVTNCADITGTAVIVGAKGGIGPGGANGTSGGPAFQGVGTTKFSGGLGGTGNNNGDTGGGGGGAGASSGDGRAGGNGGSGASTGGGGGGGGGNSSLGAAGGAAGGSGGNGIGGTGGGAGGDAANGSPGTAGTGGGGGGGDFSFTGGAGATGTDINGTVGSGGGGGGTGDDGIGGAGGLYGGGGGGGANGGGDGAQGIIVITYTPDGDTTPPSPDPMTFATAPEDASETSVSMTATTATDDTPPVQYLFTHQACASNGGTGGTTSSWQESTTYVDTGLQPNQCYGYVVKARDSEAVPNATADSSVSETYTRANTPGTPTLGSATETTLTLTHDANSNPASNPVTTFAVLVEAVTDVSWHLKYVDASGNPSNTAVWLSDTQLDGVVLQSLSPGTTYNASSKARNENGIETGFSSSGQGTTSSPPIDPSTGTRLDGGVRLRGGVQLR